MNDTVSQFTPTPLLATQQFEITDDFFPGLELVAAPTDDGTHKVVHIAVAYQVVGTDELRVIGLDYPVPRRSRERVFYPCSHLGYLFGVVGGSRRHYPYIVLLDEHLKRLVHT